MNDNKTDTLDPTVQVVEAGAMITLTPEVLTHGLVIDHPQLPLLKLFFLIEDGKYKYHFEPVKPLNSDIKTLAVKIIEPPKSGLILPGQINGKIPG